MSHVRQSVSATPTIRRPLSHNAAVRRYHTTRDALTRAHRWQCVTRRDASRRSRPAARRRQRAFRRRQKSYAISVPASPTDSLYDFKSLCTLLFHFDFFPCVDSERHVAVFFIYNLSKFYFIFRYFFRIKIKFHIALILF